MDLPPMAAWVREWLARRSVEREIVLLLAAARTAAEAAASHPHSVIRLEARDLAWLTGGAVCAVRVEGASQ